MKLFLYLYILLSTGLFASLNEKSAIVYYGEKISYPTVGIHDYIVVQPELTNTHTHGFSVYKDKLYAYVSIGEIVPTVKEYSSIDKNWIIGENNAWKSKVLDLRNDDYREFIFRTMIEPRIQEGFENFFFDTLDSYQIVANSDDERALHQLALVSFINEFKIRYPKSKLMINRGFEVIDKVYKAVDAVLFESYYKGLGGKDLKYVDTSVADREWLDIHLSKIKSYGIDIISLDYLPFDSIEEADFIAKKIVAQGMIPYISTRELTSYGRSSKNSVKREVLTIFDESLFDRILIGVHIYGAPPLEYHGYVQKLHDINLGIPKVTDVMHYSGVIVWLSETVKEPVKFENFIRELIRLNIKVVFVGGFGVNRENLFTDLGLKFKLETKVKKRVAYKDEMIGYEIDPSMANSGIIVNSKNSEALLTFEYTDGSTSTQAAITPWGGYVMPEALLLEINNENIWVINPFEFFKKSLRLESIPAPDPTTENGKRLFFTHIDGDGIMSLVERDPEKLSGDVIYEEILKPYNVPHSVSVIGAEIRKNGLFPELSERLHSIAKKIYELPNVEGATHTFSHPFNWGEIVDGELNDSYRLKVKDYKFSIDYEIRDQLSYINKNIYPANKLKAQCVFWSGNCAPKENVLDNIYKNDVLNINGGDTYITKANPWLSNVAPLGIERGEYYQIYTGAQNENIYTNNWLGPFWGFKKVVQTFKMTESPKRLKPINIYYHLYSGSKTASLNALKYVFDWSLKQDIMPIYTSEYIPKAMDFYTVSMAKEEDLWLVDGMKSLKTLRIEEKGAGLDLSRSKSTLGIKHFEDHTYISLDSKEKHILKTSHNDEYKEEGYLISANAKNVDFKHEGKTKHYSFEGYVDLKLSFNLPANCMMTSKPKAPKGIREGTEVRYHFNGINKADIKLECK